MTWKATVRENRPIRFPAPRDCLAQNCVKCMGRKQLRLFRLFLGEAHHLTHLDDDLGEREAVPLPFRYSRPYGGAKRIDEREKPFVVLGDEIIRQPGKRN